MPQLSNDNWLKVHLLSHFINVNSISDTELVAKSETKSKNRDVDKTNLVMALLAIKDKAQIKQQSTKKQTSKSDIAKYTSLFNDIFDYVYRIPCHKLYLLALYDNMIYTSTIDHSGKVLLRLYCNVSDYNSIELDYLKKRFHFNTKFTKQNE